MLDLDIRTLGWLTMMSSILLALGLQIINRAIARNACFRLWAQGATVAGAGFVLIALRGSVPDALSIVTANTLLVAGVATQYLGNRIFQGKTPESPWIWWLTATTALLLLSFTYLTPNLSARIVVISAAIAAIDFASAIVLLNSNEQTKRSVRWFVGGAYLLYAIFMAIRAIANLFITPIDQNFMATTGAIQTLAFVLQIGLDFALALGLPLLVLGKTNQQLIDSEQRYRTLIEWSPTPTGVHDGNRLLYVNPAATRMFGASSADELLTRSIESLIHPDYHQLAGSRANTAIKTGLANPPSEQKYLRLDGSIIDVEVQSTAIFYDGKSAIQIVAKDITERNAMQEQVRQLAFHDPLTGLPNRRLLADRLGLAMATNRRNTRFGALMFLDLDNFKPLNDAHGHSAGDLLLVEVAKRLSRCIREMDTVARFGGDEFVVMISELESGRSESAAAASVIAEKIRAALSQPYVLKIKRNDAGETSLEHNCTASIGLALFDGNEASQDDVLRLADMAMYQAKEAGRNQVILTTETPQSIATAKTPPAKLMHLIWHKAYECGNGVIDAQHRTLFQDANALLNALLTEENTDTVMTLINTLMNDIVRHFADEEAIFSKTPFPGAAKHITAHRQLVNDANTLVKHFHDGTLNFGELFEFLAQTVVAQHMLHEDREFFPFLPPHD